MKIARELGREKRDGSIHLDAAASVEYVARVRGLGDLVAVFAKPVARALDAGLGTDLQHCAGCADRQEKLNELLPLNHG